MASLDDIVSSLEGLRNDLRSGTSTSPAPGGTPTGTAAAAAAARAGTRRPEIEEELNFLRQLEDSEGNRADIQELIIERERLKLSVLSAQLETIARTRDLRADETEALRKQTAEVEKQLNMNRSSVADMEDLITKFTGISRRDPFGLGKLFQPGGLKALAMGAKNLFTIQGVMTTVATQSIEMALAQDKAVVAFNKATGASGAFDSQINNLTNEMRFTGVSADELGGSFEALFSEMSDFTMLTEEQQKTLGRTTALLENMGVSAASSAANIQIATKSLGMSVNQAEFLLRDLNTFARDLGVSTAQLSDDFARMAPMIVELGTDGVQAFKNLQREAKATGIDIGRLYQITSNFDTFEGAAQSVGKLNAMLGGPFLNTMDMVMEEDPAERMRMLKEAVDDAGLSFDTMSKFQRKALAESMGLNDANELALVLRGRQDLLPDTDQDAESIEAMAARQKEFNTIMEEFTQILQSLAIGLGPFISVFKTVLDVIAPIMPVVLGVGAAIAGLVGFLNPVTAAVIALVSAFAALNTWWNEGFSPSGIDTFTGIKMSTQEITVATKEHETAQKSNIITTQKNAGATRQLNTVQNAGIAGTTAATGMPAAAMMAISNQELASSMSGQQGPIILELDGREFARQTDMATSNAIGTKLTNRYA